MQECDQDETCHGLRQAVKNKHRCFRNENVEFYLVKKCHFQVTIKMANILIRAERLRN